MNVEIRSRSGWYFAVIPKQRGLGRALVKRLGTRSIEEARELVKGAQLEQQALAAKADAIGRDVWTRLLAGRRVLCREAAKAYELHLDTMGRAPKTIFEATRVVDLLLRGTGLANQSIAAIEPRHISEFVNPPTDISLSYRKWLLGMLSGFLDYCVDQRWLVRSPALDVAVKVDGLTQEQLLSVPYVPFTDAEVKTILAALPRCDFWHGATLIGYHYGLRLNEVARLEEGNVVANRLRIFTRKGRKVVDQYLHDDVLAWLTEWRKKYRPASDMTYLFPSQAATSAPKLSDQFAGRLKKLGITGKSFHSLRKTAAKRTWDDALQDLGGPGAAALARLVAQHGLVKVQQLLAHSEGSGVTAKHYL